MFGSNCFSRGGVTVLLKDEYGSHTHTHTLTCTHTHTRTHTNTHKHTHTYTHNTHTHTHARTHAHTQTHSVAQKYRGASVPGAARQPPPRLLGALAGGKEIGSAQGI